MNYKAFIGIDLGTTNSTCAVLKHFEDGSAELIPVPFIQPVSEDTNGEIQFACCNTILPSIIKMRGENEIVIGQSISDFSDFQYVTTIRSIKMQMGNNNWKIEHFSRHFTPTSLSAMILFVIRNSIAQLIPYGAIESVVITIPASFSSSMRRNTMDAVTMAGFDFSIVTLIDEPVAAAVNAWDVSEKRLIGFPENKPVMIFDMGGGTVDVTLLRISPTDKLLDIMSTSRYNDFGGDDIDIEIAAFILNQITAETSAAMRRQEPEQNLLDYQFAKSLLRHAQYLKHKMNEILPTDQNFGISVMQEYSQNHDLTIEIIVDVEGGARKVICNIGSIIEILTPYLSKDFEKNPLNIFKPIVETAERARMKANLIPNVHIVGGATQFAPINTELKRSYNHLKDHLDPIYSISHGAAKFAYLHKIDGWRIAARTHEKIYLRRSGLPFLEVLPDSLSIPCEPIELRKQHTENDSIEFSKGASHIELEFFQGISPDDPNMTLVHIERHELSNILHKDAFISGIKGWIDWNKIYHFTFELCETDRPTEIFYVAFAGDEDLQQKRIYSHNLRGLIVNGISYDVE